MKNLMKIFAVMVLVALVFGGCATTKITEDSFEQRIYGTTAMEGSIARYNHSLARVNEKFASGGISADDAREVLEIQTPIGPGQKKSVHVQKRDSERHISERKGASAGRQSDVDRRAEQHKNRSDAALEEARKKKEGK